MPAHRTGAASAVALLAIAVVALGADAYLGIDDARRHAGDAAVFEAQRIRVQREAEASGRVAARVIAGDLSLAAAVDELEPVLRERSGFESAWPEATFPTFRHRVARYVLTRVDTELQHTPLRRAIVLTRLDAEYAAFR